MTVRFSGFFLALILLAAVLAATPAAADTAAVAAPDTLQPPSTEVNNRLMVADMALLTVGVWSPSRLMGTDWAYIGCNTI